MGTWKTFDVRGKDEELLRARLVAEAMDAGTTVFDSSPMYGEAERVLGAGLGRARASAFVATKVWAREEGEADQQIEASLRYFGGSIDLYQVHNLSRIEEVLPKLQALKSTGQVRFVGVTHYRRETFPDLERWMRQGNLDTIQVPYNARDRAVEEKILPLAQELGLGVLVMEPLGTGGLLETPPPPGLLARLRPKGVQTWAQALLKWILSDPRVHVILPATARPGRPRENAAAGAAPWFDEEERQEIAQAFLR